MALYQDKNPNKLPSINSSNLSPEERLSLIRSVSLDEIIGEKSSTANYNLQQPSYQQNTVNKEYRDSLIKSVNLDDIVKTPPKVKQTPQIPQTKNFLTSSWDWLTNKASLARKAIGKVIHEVNPFGGAQPAYAPSSEEDLQQLKTNYENSILGKYNFKVNEATDEFVSGITGGIIKPPTSAPKNITDKVVQGLANIAGSAITINKIGSVFNKVANGSIKITNLLNKYPKVAKYAFPLFKNVLSLDIYGQLDPDVQNRFKQLGDSTLQGIAFGSTGFIPRMVYSIPASFGLGYGLAKMDGASDEDAIIQGGLIAVLDAWGRIGTKGEQFIKGRQADRYLKAEAIDTINKFSNIKITGESNANEIKKAYYSAAHNTHPDLNPELRGNDINFKSVNSAYEFLTGKSITLSTIEPEVKITPTEKAPTAPTTKPSTEGIQPTTLPTPITEQPVGGIKPTVKPPTQPEVITTEQPTEEVKPTTQPVTPTPTIEQPTIPKEKPETVIEINKDIKPATYEIAKKKFEEGGIYNLDNNELNAFKELNRIKNEIAKVVDEEKRDIKIVDLNIDKTGTISVDYATRESEGELVGEIITETGKTPLEIVNKIKEENPVLKTRTEKVKPAPKESVPAVKETKPPIKPVKESTQEEILEPFSKEEQERWNTNTFYPMDYNQEYQNIVFNFKDKVVENLREYGIKEIPPEIDNLLKRHEQKVIDYLRIKGESNLKAPSPLVVGPSKYPAGKARMYAEREAKAAEKLQNFEDYVLRQVKKAIPKGKLPQKTIDKWKKLAMELDRNSFGKRYLQEEIKNATGGYKEDLEAGLFNSVIRKQGRELWDKLQAEIKPEEKQIVEKTKPITEEVKPTKEVKPAGTEEFVKKLTENIPYSEKLKIFKSETNIKNLEAGLRALEKKRRDYLDAIKSGKVKRDNDLIKWNKELVEDASNYLNTIKTKELLSKKVSQEEIDNFLSGLENKYAASIIDSYTFYKRLTPKQVDYLLLKLTENGKYKPFLTKNDFSSKEAFRRYDIKTDAIKSLLECRTGKYPQWNTFEDQLNDFYNQVIKGAKETKKNEEVKPTTKEETLAFNPKNLSNPKSEEAKTEVDKIVKRSEIAKELSEKLNVPIRRGKFRQKALGIYKKHGKIIRIKGGQMLTVSHEIGHYLDDVLEDFSSKINYNETDNLIKDYSKSIQNKSESEKQVEAFGEFIRFFITEPNKATSRAPEFSKYFNERLEKYPEVKEALETARRDYKRWTEMPATSKVLSQISIGETEQSKTIKEKFTDFYIAAKDDLYPLKQYADLLKDKKIPTEENPYILARLTRGWQEKADLFLTKGTFGKNYYKVDKKGKNKMVFKGKGLKQILQPVEKAKAMNDLIAYLTSQETINGAKTGIEKADAKEAIREITQRYPDMPKWAEKVYRYDRHLLEYLYEYGMIDKKLFNKLTNLHSTHVPLYRVFDEVARQGYLGKGMANVSNQIKKRVGSERDIVNPIEGLIKNTYLIINAVDRNNVGVAMANLATADDRTARLFEKVPTPMAKVATVTAKELGIKLEDFPDEYTEKVFDIFRPSMFTPNDNTVSVLINGKKYFYQTTPEIYKTLMFINRESANMIINFLSYPTKWLRAGATLNPDFFIAKNPFRDQLTAFIYSKYGFIPGVDFMRGLYLMAGKKDEYYLAKASGAFHTMFVSMDRKYLQKTFNDIVKKHHYTDYLKNPIEVLRALSEYSEIPTRLGEFKKALDKTKNPTEAAFAFREVTLDFQKQGTVGRTINQVIAFWNSWAEGWDKLIRQFKDRPLQTSWKVILGITIPSIIFYLLNKDDERWDEIPQWQKDSFWIIMLPNKIIRLAKPFEVGMIFGSIPERILDSINTEDPQALKDLANSLIFGQLPGMIPTAIEPLVENWTNYNFFLQRPIVSESKETLPPEFQYNQYTSETAKKLGELLNYSPAKIDNLFQGWFGGLGNYATQAVDKVLIGTGISSTISKPSPTLADIPVVKSFIVRNPIGSASKSVDRFYEQYNKFNAGEKALKQMIENNEQEKYFKFKEQHPELFFNYDYSTDTFYSEPARFLRQVASILSDIRKVETEVYNSPDLTPQEKREKIDELDEIITKTANDALNVLKDHGIY